MTAPASREPESPDRARYLALVVDDVPESRLVLSTFVAKSGFDVIEAEDGRTAVNLAIARKPDIVLLDLRLPDIDGLEALSRIHDADDSMAVVLVTGATDPGLAERALELGAADFVRKPFDQNEIAFVVERIRAALDEEVDLRPALERVRERTTTLELGNDIAPLASVIALLGRELRMHYPRKNLALTPVKLALYEALVNAIEHGNLEIGFEEKTNALRVPRGLEALHRKRREEEPFRARRVFVRASYLPTHVLWTVRDEGPGFRPSAAEEALRAADATALHGRGLRLVRHAMTDVEWNASGNEIRLTLDLGGRVPAGEQA